MASYIAITDAEVDPEAPITSYLGYRWRDNPIAIAERAAGAPVVKVPTIGILTGSGNWTVPAGVTRVWVFCIGAGGGGKDGGGGGGGAGTAIGFLEVTPAMLLAYIVGAGGTGGGSPTAGGLSVFDSAPIAGGPITGGGGGVGSGSGGGGGTASGGVVNLDGDDGIIAGTAFGNDIGLGGGAALISHSREWSAGKIFGHGGGAFGGTGRNGAAGTIILAY